MENKMRRIWATVVCAAMFAAVFAVAVSENAHTPTRTVPDDYPTIQQAINGASPTSTLG